MILKIILLILAVLLGILLLLILGLLFLPFRYRITADDKKQWRVRGKFSWLGFFLRIRVCYENGDFGWKIFLLGIPIAPGKRKTRKEKRRKSGAQKAEKENIEEISQETTKEETIQIETTKKGETQTETIEVNKKEYNKIEKIKYTWKRICAKIKYMWHNTREWAHLLKSDRAKMVFALCKTEIFCILKKIRPRKLKGYVEFGTGDPASTGQCLGLIAMVYGYFGNKLQIIPDFEEKVFHGDVTCKGIIPLGPVLLSLWRIYKNKDLRALKRKIDELGGK